MSDTTTSIPRKPDSGGVLAGFDGSAAARDAVAWAAAEACQRDRPLLLARAYQQPMQANELAWTPIGLKPEYFRAAHFYDSLRGLADMCRLGAPELAISTTVRSGHPGRVLAALTAEVDASLVVVGSQEHGAFSRLVLGSTAAELVHQVDRPVVVVRGPATTGPVLLGLSGTDTDGQAIEFAFSYAAQHDCPVHAVHGHHHGRSQEELARVLAPWQARYPTVQVDTEILAGKPAQALVRQSAGARLLVVGSHHHGALHRALTGSISHATLYHAACPVAVVPAGRHPATRQQAQVAAAG